LRFAVPEFNIRVFNFNPPSDTDIELTEWVANTVLEPVSELKLSGQDEREVAAQAYVLGFGLQRAYALKYEMDAPPFLILHEIDVAGIARELQEGKCWAGRCLYLDNQHEVFYFVIDKSESDSSSAESLGPPT
jgi:hypothetical protein